MSAEYEKELQRTYGLIEQGARSFEEAAQSNACVLCKNDLLALAKAGRDEIKVMRLSEEYSKLKSLKEVPGLTQKIEIQVKEGEEIVAEAKGSPPERGLLRFGLLDGFLETPVRARFLRRRWT